jgi:squalene synthase HpnC
MALTDTDHPLAKLATENFPVAPAMLPPGYRDDLRALYAFARLVDDIGDQGPDEASPASILACLDTVRADLDRVFSGLPAGIPALTPLTATVQRRHLPRAPFEALLAANRMDQTVTNYVDRRQLLRYCRLSANPVGRLVLGVFGVRLTPARRAGSDALCTALQIVEHLQDIGEDAARGRIYLPREDRHRHGVLPTDLRARSASPNLCRLVLAEASWAEELLRQGSGLVGMLNGWPRLAVAGYVAGGAAALRDLRRSGGNTLSRLPARRRTDLAVTGFRILAKGGLR